MITCTIGGERAVPVLGSGINITVENAYISDKEEYTYDITFPLDILENRRIFGPVGRIGTSKKRRSFENVSLVCDNMEVIRGRGVVTESNQKELKMQVLAGYSRIKYMSAAEGKFIDTLPIFDFDRERMEGYARRCNPEIEIYYISAKTGEGVDALADAIVEKVKAWCR